MPARRLAVALIVLASLLPGHAAAVEGRVWLDANANGRVDPGEHGVAGCLVSDGSQLARTDAAGHYRLEPSAAQAAVFIVNRPGTWPVGPWWRPVANPTSCPTIDFALREQGQDGPLLFAQGTDIHLQPAAVPLYRKYIAHLNAIGVPLQFVVHTGDLVVDSLACDVTAAEKLFELYEGETKGIRHPVRNLAGNHEHVGVARKDLAERTGDYAKGMYLRRLGPLTYAFRYGPCHFLALDGTTLDPQGKSGYRDRLDDASVAWAVRYLASVGPGEPIILLVHQPLADRDTDRLLLSALAGKRLLAVLCGHGHGRSVTTWGGAPMIMGGAVSYAWHGFLPYPPDPWSYVVYRLEGSKLEYAFLDWDAQCSVDLRTPAWGTIVAKPHLDVQGTISDFDGSVRRVTCRLGSSQTAARVTRSAHLVSRFEAVLDISSLADGVYDLAIEIGDQGQSYCHARPLIVKGGRSQALAAGPAPTVAPVRLRFQGARGPSEAPDVRLNGQPLDRSSASKGRANEWTFDLPPDGLQRLNQITISPDANGTPDVSRLRIEYAGRGLRDVRFSPTAKRGTSKAGATRASLDYYIDLTYPGPRGRFDTGAPDQRRGH